MTTTMFPVCLKSRGAEHWFAWRSVQDPEGAIARSDERPLVSSSLSALSARWRETHQEIAIDHEPLTIDLDALIANLRDGLAMDSEALLNALNMLDDVAHACRATGRPETFGCIVSHGKLYDIVFSRTRVARLVQVPFEPTSAADRPRLVEWLEAGAEMVRETAMPQAL